MDEREQLLKNINNSAGDISSLQAQEKIIEELTAKRDMCEKNTKLGRTILFAFLGFILGLVVTAAITEILGWVVIFALPIALHFYYKSKLKQYNKKIEEEEVKRIAIANSPNLSWLPPNYRDTFSYAKITEYVINERAGTIKEAINLLETEMHQSRVEILSYYGSQR